MEVGDVVGRWTLVEKSKTKDRHLAWRCVCKCGKEKIVRESYLTLKKSLSCGCSEREYEIGDKIGEYEVVSIEKKERVYYIVKCKCGRTKVIRADILKGLKNKHCGCLDKNINSKYIVNAPIDIQHKKLLDCWHHMKRRCYVDTCKAYHNYGGRGISICDVWKNDFLSFKAWSLSNGFRIGLTIDRINCDGNYEPSNCRFISLIENCRNKRNTKITMEIAETIRSMYINGFKQCELATMFNLTAQNIHNIVKNKRWKDALK